MRFCAFFLFVQDFVALRTSWMRGRDGFVLVFSIVDHKSFDELQSFYDQLMEVYEENVPPFVLVGNKCDLDPNSDSNKNNNNEAPISNYQRRVSVEEATELAQRWRAVRYIETSAKTGYHVQDMFGGLVRYVNRFFILCCFVLVTCTFNCSCFFFHSFVYLFGNLFVCLNVTEK